MLKKVCTKCGRELPIEDFPFRDKSKGTRRADCKQCHSNHMKNKYQEKKELVQEWKSNAKCAKCGDTRGYVLDYHHINPENKITTIARLTSNTSDLNKIKEEIEKCIVLCANCHREFHYLNDRNSNLTLENYLLIK